MCEGMLCFKKTCSRNTFASSGEVMVLCMGMKIHCFESQSTTTRMEVKPEEAGSCSMKSMDMEFHGHLGIRSCLRRLNGLCQGVLACMQDVQEDT